MRRFFTLAAVVLAALACSAVLALDCGFKDANTGKVWSQSIRSLSSPNFGSYSWQYSINYAANYTVWDLNDNGVMTYYDDWRLPTVSELQAAVADGTIQGINQNSAYVYTGIPGNNRDYFLFFTSQTKGNQVWTVRVYFGPNGEVLSGGQTQLVLYKPVSSYGDAFLVRP